MRYSVNNLASFWSNPVVVRDMRIRMRGTRSYWNQALYLAVLSIIAVTGYATSTSFAGMSFSDPIEIQARLQQFYYWIFEGLAVLISLIAPALTAASIITEKKMQTLDLLVTTPMSSMQMLLGKLISSIAFIFLLLALSIPASALCIILGGSTIGDVLQSYALLAMSGILMAAIGLAASCSAKQHIQAIVSTYGVVLLLLVLTFSFGVSTMAMLYARIFTGSHAAGPAFAAIFELNPFLAAAYPSFDISILGLHIPVWLGTAIVCFILVRLILTGAAIELGSYGTSLVSSQRRQMLIATLLFTFLFGQSISSLFSGIGSTSSIVVTYFQAIVSVIFGLSLFFLPKLFVPIVNENAAPGSAVGGSYSLRGVFAPQHRGSLPFFQLWLFVMISGIAIGIALPSGASSPMTAMWSRLLPPEGTVPVLTLTKAAGYVFFYLSGLGFLMWSLARRAATWSSNPIPARAVTFLLFALLIAAPCMIMAFQAGLYANESYNPYTQNDVRFFWLLFPFTDFDMKTMSFPSIFFLIYGAVGYGLGLLAYPVWADVVPGGRIKARRPMRAREVR